MVSKLDQDRQTDQHINKGDDFEPHTSNQGAHIGEKEGTWNKDYKFATSEDSLNLEELLDLECKTYLSSWHHFQWNQCYRYNRMIHMCWYKWHHHGNCVYPGCIHRCLREIKTLYCRVQKIHRKVTHWNLIFSLTIYIITYSLAVIELACSVYCSWR